MLIGEVWATVGGTASGQVVLSCIKSKLNEPWGASSKHCTSMASASGPA